MDRKLVYEVVYDELKQRIAQGVWKPGERIPTLEEISSELKVGISSVREAVRILGKQGILVIEQGRGTHVSDKPPLPAEGHAGLFEDSSWMQLTEARLVIEPELAAMAAAKAPPEAAEAILACAETMQRKVSAGKPFLKEDIEFHERIATAAGNEVLDQMIKMIGGRLLESRRKTMRLPGMDEKAAAYHVLIARAIADRQPQQARELMRMHIVDMVEALEKQAKD